MPLDLLYSETETQLRDAVRDVLADKAAWRDVLARTETEQTYDVALWRALAAEVGVAGLLIPESAGGAGATYREAAVVAEEIGRSVAPVPFLGSAVVATTVLVSLRADELLSELASGSVTAALAVPFATVPFATVPVAAGTGRRPDPTVRLDASEPGDEPGTYRLTGTVAGVADALPADVLLVPGDGVPYGLYAVRAAHGVVKHPVVSLDQTRQLCDLTLERAPARQLAADEAAVRALRAGLLAGAGLLASEQLGIAEQCLQMTLDYVKDRKQFARPVGGFQALKHRLADLWVMVTLARAAARAAADGLASRSGTEAELLVALAKAACSDTALKAAQETIQLHGGIGFTWEHPAHLFLKRAKADSIGFGTADAHRAWLASLADLPPAPG
ncbi:MAG: acyl-CoA/acyl-ACP dehydrogenase [Actinobacteria bacterium]|nr:acyl-CoA/acyl-ACP dehydrogenase [Actinomycetota bacterium]MBO0836414.1 acyl-CoA/acyl-ACP dehydrogenase [Actinomycetota bacterium]